MAKNITRRVWEIAESFLPGMGLEVYDVVFVKEGGNKVLRLYIDGADRNVNIGECEQVSMKMSEYLDGEDIIKEAYIFEVSSPGIERQLKYDRHFEKAAGQTVDVKLYKPEDGKKVLTGKLISGGEKKSVVIETDEGIIETEPEKIAEVKIHFEF